MGMNKLLKIFGVREFNGMTDGFIEALFNPQLKKSQFSDVFDEMHKAEDVETSIKISEVKNRAALEVIEGRVTTQADSQSSNYAPRKKGVQMVMSIYNPNVGERTQTIPVSAEWR